MVCACIIFGCIIVFRFYLLFCVLKLDDMQEIQENQDNAKQQSNVLQMIENLIKTGLVSSLIKASDDIEMV